MSQQATEDMLQFTEQPIVGMDINNTRIILEFIDKELILNRFSSSRNIILGEFACRFAGGVVFRDYCYILGTDADTHTKLLVITTSTSSIFLTVPLDFDFLSSVIDTSSLSNHEK